MIEITNNDRNSLLREWGLVKTIEGTSDLLTITMHPQQPHNLYDLILRKELIPSEKDRISSIYYEALKGLFARVIHPKPRDVLIKIISMVKDTSGHLTNPPERGDSLDIWVTQLCEYFNIELPEMTDILVKIYLNFKESSGSDYMILNYDTLDKYYPVSYISQSAQLNSNDGKVYKPHYAFETLPSHRGQGIFNTLWQIQFQLGSCLDKVFSKSPQHVATLLGKGYRLIGGSESEGAIEQIEARAKDDFARQYNNVMELMTRRRENNNTLYKLEYKPNV